MNSVPQPISPQKPVAKMQPKETEYHDEQERFKTRIRRSVRTTRCKIQVTET